MKLPLERVIILTEGNTSPLTAKTATGVLRYRPDNVVALLDSTCAGKTCQEVLDFGGDTPIVASLDDVDASTLMIGISPSGGKLPESWRETIRSAIRKGMSIVSGLHYFLSEDEEFKELAKAHKTEIHDVRRPPPNVSVAKDLVRLSPCHRVHTVGHDCSVGKMVASLEINRGISKRGYRTEFVATGQTGIMISGWGVPADRVISDFVAGAVEDQILAHDDKEFLLVEGQGSLVHPLYSAVTLGLLHGCAPQTMVLVFEPIRKIVKSSQLPMPPLDKVITAFEHLANILCPSKVVALAANTSRMSTDDAERAMREAEEKYGLPTADVFRHGPDRIVDAILKRHEELKSSSASSAS